MVLSLVVGFLNVLKIYQKTDYEVNSFTYRTKLKLWRVDEVKECLSNHDVLRSKKIWFILILYNLFLDFIKQEIPF